MRKAVSKRTFCISSSKYSGSRDNSKLCIARHSQEAEEHVLFDRELLDQLAEGVDLVLAPAQV